MAERVPAPTDADKTNWATGGGAYAKGDPGSPKRDSGFKPLSGTPGDVIPAEDHNFLWNLGMLMISWFRDFTAREWADVAEAITATTSLSQLFRVYRAITGTGRWRGFPVFQQTTTATGGGTVYDLCTDGEQIYYISGATSEHVVIASPVDGSGIDEESAPGGSNFTALCSDGGFLYATTDAAGQPGLRRLLRSDGSSDGSAGAEYACSKLRANGFYAAGISPFSDNGGVVIWSDVQDAGFAEDGVYSADSAQLVGLAIDHLYAYAGGVRGAPSTIDVWAVLLSTGALGWGVTLPTGAAPTVADIVTDGTFVYVATTRVALTAGGNANLFVLDRYEGTLLATADVADITGAACNLTNLAVDDLYLYAQEDGTDWTKILDKVTLYQISRISDFVPHCADGVSVVGRDFTTATDFRRVWVAGATKTFMRARPDDTARRPFPNLAIPVER